MRFVTLSNSILLPFLGLTLGCVFLGASKVVPDRVEIDMPLLSLALLGASIMLGWGMLTCGITASVFRGFEVTDPAVYAGDCFDSNEVCWKTVTI